GALLCGWFAERFGRLRTLIVATAIFSFMSIVCAFAWDFQSLAIFKLIQGIGLGGEVPVATSYISEIARSKGRGRFFILYELAFAFGLTATGFVGVWVVPHLGWQAMFYIGAAPAIMVFFMAALLPESPRWLASKGRLAEADRAVGRIEKAIIRSGRVLPPVDPAALDRPDDKPTDWRELFRGIYRRRTICVWFMWACGYAVTYGLMTWLPSLFTKIYHLPPAEANAYGLYSQLVGNAGSIVCAFVIDIVGRRRFYTTAFFGSFASLGAFWLFAADTPTSMFICGAISQFFISGIAISLYIYTAELYPTRIRAFGTSIATAWLRLASAIAPSAIGFLLATTTIQNVFLVFAGIALLGALVTLFFATETTNRHLEELSP
ncbi:MAG: major facilitator superfamily protein, partial [Rhodospirillales bacterium]|nr:major facilitator superfamily protein [Rhodospirillales bacterium]